MWNVFELFQFPDWPRERLFELPGHCSGGVLRDWDGPLRDRFGTVGVEKVRAKLALDGLLLPDSFGSGQWYPVWMQIVLTQTIRKVFFECDTPGFCEMLIHAGRTSASPWMTTMLRFVGPAAVLRRADLLHPHFYDVGAISSVVTGRAAELMCKDAVLFENPTWRALQLAGQQGLIELTGSKLVSAVGMDAGAGAFRMKVSWT